MNLANKIVSSLGLLILVLTPSFGHIPSVDSEPSAINDSATKTHAHIWSRLAEIFDLDHAEGDPLVKFYIRHYLKNPRHLNDIARNASLHMGSVLLEIERRGLPGELALLPIIESDYNPFAKNPRSGANGLWQLMPSTNKIYRTKNLGINPLQSDFRIIDSTHAALNYLEYLRDYFDGNWLHAIAAYNAGEGRIKKEIKKNQQNQLSTEFWDLNLPKETKSFVPRLLALASIMKNPARYHCRLHTMVNAEQAPPTSEPVICADSSEFMDFMIPLQPKQPFNHRTKSYKIKPGDSLTKIAKQNKISVASLKKANQLKNNSLKVGKFLIIPVA